MPPWGKKLKLGLSLHAYVPATTRAMLACLGMPTVFEIQSRYYSMSTEEMPGEFEWRADYLSWMIRRFVHYLARRPSEDWGETMAEIEDEAIRKRLLVNGETGYVAEAVLTTLDDMEPLHIAQLANNAAQHDAELGADGRALCARFERMVVEHGTRVK